LFKVWAETNFAPLTLVVLVPVVVIELQQC